MNAVGATEIKIATEADMPTWVPGLDEAAWAAVCSSCDAEAERAARSAAFEAYRHAPWPQGKMEEWRRTDPARFPFAKMRRLPQLIESACAPHPWDEDFSVVLTVQDAAFQIMDRRGAVQRGEVQVWPLAQALSRGYVGPLELERWGTRPDRVDKFAVAPEAFWNVGFYIAVSAGVRLERGILVRYHHQVEGCLLMPRIIFHANEGSEAAVVEWHDSPPAAEVMTVASKRLLMGDRARVGWYTLRDEGPRAVHLADEWATLRRDAKLDWVTLNLGGRVLKTRFTSDASAPGASAELDGLYFAHHEQHVDQKTLQVHSSPDTYSRLLYKGAVKDRAYSVYQGQIIARPGAVRVDAYQKNNNLVLNDGARADSMPGLQIDADDLKCSHGSTIGNLDEEQLFYLRSRGIEERAARATLIRAFFEEVVQRIPYQKLRERLQQRVDERLV